MTAFHSVANQIESILASSDNPEKVIMEMYRTDNEYRKELIFASILGLAISKTKQLEHAKNN